MFEWIETHWSDITTIVAYVVAIASVIVKLTPTVRDDTILLKVVKIISKFFALNRTVKDDEIRKIK